MKQELTTAELEARFAQINARPPEQMTEEEAHSLAEARAMDDGTTITLEELRRELLPADATRILSEFAEDYQQLATHPDPFYSAENLSHLRRATADLDAGRGTPHDLIAAQQEPVEECVPYDPNENW